MESNQQLIDATIEEFGGLLFPYISNYSVWIADRIEKKFNGSNYYKYKIKNVVEKVIPVRKLDDYRISQIVLRFDLLVSHLAVSSVEILKNTETSKYYAEIIDCLVELLYTDLEKLALNHIVIPGDKFIKDPQERLMILNELRQVKGFEKISSLPQLGLTAITDFILTKRFNSYRTVWIDDLMNQSKNKYYIPQLPSVIYNNWTSNQLASEKMSFGLLLNWSYSKTITTTTTILSKLNISNAQ